jgi:hypothetical protein
VITPVFFDPDVTLLMRLRLTAALLSCAVMGLPSCTMTQKSGSPGPAAPATDSPPAGSVLKLAQVEAVKAEVSPTQPPEAIVVINGLLHDGATRIHEVQQQRFADSFVLTVTTSRPPHAVATLALIPFERTVSLNLQGMAKGPCKIVVNGVETSVVVP